MVLSVKERTVSKNVVTVHVGQKSSVTICGLVMAGSNAVLTHAISTLPQPPKSAKRLKGESDGPVKPRVP